MPLKLILIRHAKSSWTNLELSDHERVLNTRGIASAKAVGAWLEQRNQPLGHVFCSDASRTRETFGLISAAFDGATPVTFLPDLYLASQMAMLTILRGAGDVTDGDTVTMIGHNPGIGDLAVGLAATRPAHPKFALYPTCATTIYEFDVTDWAAVAPGRGQIVDFTVPRDLIGA